MNLTNTKKKKKKQKYISVIIIHILTKFTMLYLPHHNMRKELELICTMLMGKYTESEIFYIHPAIVQGWNKVFQVTLKILMFF